MPPIKTVMRATPVMQNPSWGRGGRERVTVFRGFGSPRFPFGYVLQNEYYK